MRFSENGYYIERYVKCANCGLLVYGERIGGERHGKSCVYCSPWCIESAALRDREEGYFSLPIVQPKLPLEAAHRELPPRTEPPDMVLMKILDSMVSICREVGILADEDVPDRGGRLGHCGRGGPSAVPPLCRRPADRRRGELI